MLHKKKKNTCEMVCLMQYLTDENVFDDGDMVEVLQVLVYNLPKSFKVKKDNHVICVVLHLLSTYLRIFQKNFETSYRSWKIYFW